MCHFRDCHIEERELFKDEMIVATVRVVKIEHINIDVVDKFAEEVINEVMVILSNHDQKMLVNRL